VSRGADAREFDLLNASEARSQAAERSPAKPDPQVMACAAGTPISPSFGNQPKQASPEAVAAALRAAELAAIDSLPGVCGTPKC